MGSRSYCFTLNNPEGPLDLNKDEIRYAIYQEEEGEQGTRHFQGYLELKKPMRLTAVKKLVPALARAHFETRKGTREQAREYCRKADTQKAGPFEFGVWIAGQGERSDLQSVRRAIIDGKSDLELADEFFDQWVKYRQAFKEYRLLKTGQRDWKTQFELFIGPPGCGKSLRAKSECPDAYWKPRDEWWDGYQSQPYVILDDFYGWLPWDQLLRITDRYPLNVQVKGSTVPFQARKVVITSNSCPLTWYKRAPSWDALFRRVTKYVVWNPASADPIEINVSETPTDQEWKNARDEFLAVAPK